MEEKTKQKVKCPKCQYVFETGSKLGLVSCPNCGSKFKRKENIIAEDKE